MTPRISLATRTLWLSCLLGLSACAGGGDGKGKGDVGPDTPPDVPGEPPGLPGDGESDFISDVPGESSLAPNAGLGAQEADSSDDGGSEFSSGDASRAIAEADIIQIQGDRLFALSRYAGMHIIDVSNPSQLRVLGRYRVKAEPFEMYLKGSVAYVMYNAFGSYEYEESAGGYTWRESSRMQALDVANPAAIKVIGSYNLAGAISDSRMVGDVIYAVTYENGYCWGCDTKPNTRVASFDIKDPSKFVLVDQLRFTDDTSYSWGPRSVSVNDQRMFVAGRHWDDKDGTIQVVDIADPAGDLKLGAEITIHGSINSRWQMDEYKGVLRVVSQPVSWRSNDTPHVQTFRIDDSEHLVPLANLAMVLPRPEELQSARFDGDRGYAVTFERTDPLFTLDLSDPAAPKQVGELEIPGFLYHMEPRGNLLYALGFEQGNAAGSLHVSIFDVSDLATPVLSSRVNFGGEWSHLSEDQDRVHKLFNLSLDQNLIMIPYGGGTYDELSCHYEYTSGIQLIDAVDKQLTLRGVAPQLGEARRAMLHRDHLFGITDNAVQVFNIADRSHPTRIEQLEVARNVQYVKMLGQNVLRFGVDWWTSRAVLDIAAPGGVDQAEGLGMLELKDDNASNGCNRWSGWDGRLFVHGNYAYLPRQYNSYDGNTSKHELNFSVIDLHDQTAPKVVGSFAVEAATNNEWFGEIVMTDSALLVGRTSGYYDYWNTNPNNTIKYRYDIFDLENPAAPVFKKRFEVPSTLAYGGWGHGMGGCGVDMYWGYWHGGTSALVSGDIVVSQHEVDVNDGTKRVRYYLDRLDVSDPQNPVLLPPVNIPGQVVHYDHEDERAVTVNYIQRAEPADDWQDCSVNGYSAWFDDRAQVCNIYERQVNVLKLSGDHAKRISQLKLDGERFSSSIGVTSERIFYVSMPRVPYDGKPVKQRLESLAFAPTGHLQPLPSVELEGEGDYYYYGSDIQARGTRAFVQRYGSMLELQTKNKFAPKLQKHELPGWGCSSLEIGPQYAYCAAYQYGVVSMPLTD